MSSTSSKRIYATKKKVPAKKRMKAETSLSLPQKVFNTPRTSLYSTGFPERMRMKHKYRESLHLTGTAGASATYIFSCNGMYDPNITGTGHQPMFFDNMAALYDHYTVLNAKITVVYIPTPQSTITSHNFVVGLLDASAFATNNSNYLGENPSMTSLVVQASSNNQVNIITKYWNAERVFGSRALSDSQLRGTPSANPSEQTYFGIMIQDTLAIGTAEGDISVTIEYDSMWTEAKNQTGN